jgi:hypothetical protein
MFGNRNICHHFTKLNLTNLVAEQVNVKKTGCCAEKGSPELMVNSSKHKALLVKWFWTINKQKKSQAKLL